MIHASTDDLRRSLDVARLDPDLIAALYLRLRESLEGWDGISEGELVEQATFTVYLTATAWAPAGEPGPALLDSIRTRIAATVAASPLVARRRHRNINREKGAEP